MPATAPKRRKAKPQETTADLLQRWRNDLTRWREGRGLSLNAAAEMAGVSGECWRLWERGAREPLLSKALDVERVTGGAVTAGPRPEIRNNRC